MCKFRPTKIERIDEEDEATSSIMQSEDQEEKKEEQLTKEALKKSLTNEFNFVELDKYDAKAKGRDKQREDNDEVLNNNIQQFKQKNHLLSKNSPEKNSNGKTARQHIQTEPTEIIEKSADGKNSAKKMSSNRKIEQSNTSKPNGMSVVEMLQKKHLNFINNVTL